MTKHLSTLGFVAAATALAALAGCHQPSPKPVGDKTAQVERGRLLVSIGGCNDCHTPMKFDADVGMPVPDMSRMLSGHPQGAPEPAAAPAGHDMGVIGATMTSFRLPFGTVFTANLTPDLDTGLGEAGGPRHRRARPPHRGQHPARATAPLAAAGVAARLEHPRGRRRRRRRPHAVADLKADPLAIQCSVPSPRQRG